MTDPTTPPAAACGPLTADEWAALAASIEHLSGPDAWDEGQLEPALVPVTHYVPRLMAEVEQLWAQATHPDVAIRRAEFAEAENTWLRARLNDLGYDAMWVTTNFRKAVQKPEPSGGAR